LWADAEELTTEDVLQPEIEIASFSAAQKQNSDKKVPLRKEHAKELYKRDYYLRRD
jgi:hypothetical protein